MSVKGKVFKYGANVDTDVIIPARYLNRSEPAELARHGLEDLDQTFVQRVQPGDMIVAGKNFGCGSSREHAPIAIKACGVSCVIAPSFARIFFRNAINMGLPILECAEAAEKINDGGELELEFGSGEIQNLTSGESYQSLPDPPFIEKIIAADGLMGTLQKQD